MKRIIITALIMLAVASFSTAKAQADYGTGIGFRLSGWHNGLTLKHFISGQGALEGILSTYGGDGWYIRGLYEHHLPFFDVQHMNWYFGGGAYLGLDDTYSAVGLLGTLGLEYTFQAAPLSLGLDWQPMFPLTHRDYYKGYHEGGGFFIRYNFN